MKMRFLPDEPIQHPTRDALGLDPFLDNLLAAIQGTSTPFVYGVLGDWGVGKTSILHLLRKRLDDLGKHYVTIWFNAWKYENEQNMVYPLLYAIKGAYEAQNNQVLSKGFKKSFLRVLGSSALGLADLGLRVVTKTFTGQALGVKDVKEHLTLTDEAIEKKAEWLDAACGGWVDRVNKIEGAFRDLLDVYADEWGKAAGVVKDDVRFVLFVDDLDRCLPDTAIEVLESIKNFLAVDKCIFVLGLNPAVVAEGIRIKYKGLNVDGRRYLEKILNYSFQVPEPALTSVKKFAADQLGDLVLDAKDRKALDGHFQEFGSALEACRFDNPRKIKRILNRYLFFLGRYRNELASFHNANVVRLIVLGEYYPDLLQLLLYQEKSPGLLRDLVKGKEPVADFEKVSGLVIASRVEELARHGDLFDFIELAATSEGPKRTLAEHVRAVAAISVRR